MATPSAIQVMHVDASKILRAGFQRRIMAFVSDSVRNNFLNKCDGLLELSKIEMLVCDELPPEMRAEIAEFQTAAKSEVGDKGRELKRGGPEALKKRFSVLRRRSERSGAS